MGGGRTVVADGMKERLQLYLNETQGSVITGLRIKWSNYTLAGRSALLHAEEMGSSLARAQEVLERFGDSWKDWVVTRGAKGIVPFSLEQAERLIALHELGKRIKFDGEPHPAEFVAILTPVSTSKP